MRLHACRYMYMLTGRAAVLVPVASSAYIMLQLLKYTPHVQGTYKLMVGRPPHG